MCELQTPTLVTATLYSGKRALTAVHPRTGRVKSCRYLARVELKFLNSFILPNSSPDNPYKCARATHSSQRDLNEFRTPQNNVNLPPRCTYSGPGPLRGSGCPPCPLRGWTPGSGRAAAKPPPSPRRCWAPTPRWPPPPSPPRQRADPRRSAAPGPCHRCCAPCLAVRVQRQ
jgi:hypothetical protein